MAEPSDIDTICAQTNYTPEQAHDKLAEFGTPIEVIRDYMGVKPKATPLKSANQIVYTEIGKFMEDKYRTVGR